MKLFRSFSSDRWRLVPRPTGDVETINYCGLTLELPSTFLTPTIRDAFARNYYEAEERNELASLLQEGEVVLEVGAGIGFISTLCAKDERVRAVYAVEANPGLIPICRRTHELNGVQVTVYNEVLAREDGIAEFHIHQDFWASSTTGWPGSVRTTVKQTSFQRRLDEIAPTLLIVDIEGGELTLFDDVRLPTVRKIMVEVHMPVIGRAGVKHLFDTLSAQGFHYDPHHSNRAIVTFSAIDRDSR